MSAKTFTKLTKFLQGFLSDHLEAEDLDGVMSAWTEQKTEVTKILGDAPAPTRATRKKKDPNAPKKWCSSYLWFCSEERPKVNAEHPDMKATEVTTELGRRWRELSDKKKTNYEKKSAEDKVRYIEEMKSYTPPEPTEEDSSKKKSKKTKNTGPKKGLSSYLFFCAEAREQVKSDHPELKGKDITVELGRRWRELSDKEKEPYQAQAEADKARYESEKANGEETVSSPKKAAKGKASKGKKEPAKKASKGKKEPAKKEPTKKEPTKKASKKEPEPEPEPELVESDAESSDEEIVVPAPASKKSKTGYVLFCQEKRTELTSENPKMKPAKMTQELAKAWRTLDEDERDEYNERAADGEEAVAV